MSALADTRTIRGVPVRGLVLSWRRLGKIIAGLALVAVGGLTVEQQLFVHASRDAVINARVSVIRAPIDGVARRTFAALGAAVEAGAEIGGVEDAQADDARAFQLESERAAIAWEREALSRRLGELRQARQAADDQAEAFRLGRIRETGLRIEEAQAQLAAAQASESNATSVATRGAFLAARGFKADAAQEEARHAQEIAIQTANAIRKRIAALEVELEAARRGTYLGDNYNDVPSSYQRARDLALRIDDAEQALAQLDRRAAFAEARLATERRQLGERSRATLTAPVTGPVWSVETAPGEYVRKGQELFTILDCSTAMVTASVSEHDYNRLHLGDPVRFRISGSGREFSGAVSKLGVMGAGTLAIPTDRALRQIGVSVPGLADSPDDRCAVGRSGQVIFGSGSSFGWRLRAWLGLS